MEQTRDGAIYRDGIIEISARSTDENLYMVTQLFTGARMPVYIEPAIIQAAAFFWLNYHPAACVCLTGCLITRAIQEPDRITAYYPRNQYKARHLRRIAGELWEDEETRETLYPARLYALTKAREILKRYDLGFIQDFAIVAKPTPAGKLVSVFEL